MLNIPYHNANGMLTVCVVKQNTWLVLAKQPDANHSKECYHRRHFFFTENRDLKVVITTNRLVF